MLIFGLGQSGKAVAKYCSENGIKSVVADDAHQVASNWIREQAIDSLVITSTECCSHIEKYEKELCVVAPGIPPTHPLRKELQKRNALMINEIELAFQLVEGRRPNIIAVTGTNGKTTVVELVTHILRYAGKTAEAIGNIGVPVIDAFRLTSWPEWFVMELSSFQLELLQQRAITFGCWLNLTPNHLDWHPDMNEYRMAKEKIASLVCSGGACVVHESIGIGPVCDDVQLIRFGKRADSDVFLDGKQTVFCKEPHDALPEVLITASGHDQENYLASLALSRLAGVPQKTIRESYATFKKPSHRIEFVADRGGIQFWDDSKGTNIAATTAAVMAVPGPIVLIAGGVHKGSSYASWKESFQGKVKAIFAIGQAKELIAQEVGEVIPVKCVETLEEAVRNASTYLTPSFSVLLSPGCSSYDMFCDYKERGRQFQEIARTIDIPCAKSS